MPKKSHPQKFGKQYTIEANQWFQNNFKLQKKKIRCHLNKVLKEKREEKVQLEFRQDEKEWRPLKQEEGKKQEKLKRNFVLKAGLLNAEGIDRPGKREELSKKWEAAKLDIVLIPET